MKVGDTFTFRSILSDTEKENIEMQRMLRRTKQTIRNTKKTIKRLERMKIWTERNLYEMAHS